jgi:hypothetical protein
MSVYCVSYDLNKSGQNYNALYDEIKRSPGWIHALDSLWFISTNENATEVSARIKRVVDQNDNYIVIQLIGNYNGWLPQNVWDWLHTHL